jgi:hypothetical protein
MRVALARLSVALALVGVAALTAVVPLAASATDHQDVTLTLGLIEFDGAAVTNANGQVVQAEGEYFGVASGPSPFFGGEAGGEIHWTVNTAKTRGGLSGAFSITGNPAEISWFGELHGRITPEGGAGTIVADAVVAPDSPFPYTAKRLVGTWTYDGAVDPTTSHALLFTVTAVVST